MLARTCSYLIDNVGESFSIIVAQVVIESRD